MASSHGYCTLHKIAYNRTLDPICPQCSVAHIVPFKSLDFDTSTQKPLNAQGEPVEPADVTPESL
jgi:hypothetical protein